MLPILVAVAALTAGAAPAPDLSLALPGPARGGGALALGAPAAPRTARWGGGATALRQEEGYDEPDDEDDGAPAAHLFLSGWGGEAFAGGGTGRASAFYGGEVAWAFSQLDLGLAGSFYRSLRDASRTWTPVVLTRVTQRFTTGRGLQAAFSVGLGAGRPSGWIGWYQVALGVRLPLGPFFLGGELAFERYDIIRLAGGLGIGF